MRTCAIIFLTLASLLGAFAQQCGKQAGGALCPEGFCCSEYGWCGVTAAHCGEGCQSQCIQRRCGRQGGGSLCPGGLCCSQYGYCGLTDAYCAQGCQSQCQERCGKQADGALCSRGLCCSQYGWCGSTDAHCGTGCQSQCFTAQCGRQAGGALCPGGLCCSEHGWCGSTDAYCGKGCQSQCSTSLTHVLPPPPIIRTLPPSPGSGGNLSSLIPQSLFEEMLKHRNDARCPANGFYTYDAFISAASAFPDFATVGDTVTRKREIAAFLAQTSHETTGGWADAPDGLYAWGYCFVREIGEPGGSCVPNGQWPCVPGQSYYGRGPIQLSYNYNYGPAGEALGYDVLSNPDLVATDSVISFKTAFWFWMTPQSTKPSCHEVITSGWTPSPSDTAAGRAPGFGVITNIINGGLECGHGPDDRVENRIGFYKRYCDLLGIGYGENLDCNNQRPFGNVMEYYSSMK